MAANYARWRWRRDQFNRILIQDFGFTGPWFIYPHSAYWQGYLQFQDQFTGIHGLRPVPKK